MRDSIVQYILSTLLIGIPEMLLVSLISLSVLGCITSLKVNRLRFVIMVIATAIILNISEILKFDRLFAYLFGLIVLAIWIKAITSKSNWKIILSVGAAFAYFVITELMFGLPIYTALNLSEEVIANNTMIAFWGSMPERTLQFVLFYVFSICQIKNFIRSDGTRFSIFAVIRNSKKYRTYYIIGLLVMILWNSTICTMYTTYGIMKSVPVFFVVIFTFLAMLLSILPVMGLTLQIYYSTCNIKDYLKFAAKNIKINTNEIYQAAIEADAPKAIRSVENINKIVDSMEGR